MEARKGIDVSAPPQSESREPSSDRSQNQAQPRRDSPGLWLSFGLFVLGFLILVVESKFTLPSAADYALKGLGGGLCLVTVVWIRRRARESNARRGINKSTPANHREQS